jgi:2-C-methyl-D-erythritol 4-phosphate cytidylyltransferase
LEVGGKPVVAWAAQAVCDIVEVDEIVVVCDPERVEAYAHDIIAHVEGDKPLSFVAGGDTRTRSVRNGLGAIADAADSTIVLIHDGARPLASSEMMRDALQMLVDTPEADGVVVGYPSIDTLKRVEEAKVIETPARSTYWVVQTTQIFRKGVLLRAYEHADKHDVAATDDSSLVEAAGYTVVLHEGPRDNIKITCPEDVAYVESALRLRR